MACSRRNGLRTQDPSRSAISRNSRVSRSSRNCRRQLFFYPAFLGIPYAQPPVENLRWEAPRTNQLHGTVNATRYGISCTQFASTATNVYNRDVLEFKIADFNRTREDCLTLSVWTPRHARNLPVLIFFYGGDWYTGGQDTPYQIPAQWVQRTKDLIVVVPK